MEVAEVGAFPSKRKSRRPFAGTAAFSFGLLEDHPCFDSHYRHEGHPTDHLIKLLKLFEARV